MTSSDSRFGIPSGFFINRDNLNVKLIFDPDKSFFSHEKLVELRQKFDYILLFDGCEPPLLNNIETEIINYNHYFDYIYSRNPKIYSNFENSKKFIFGSSWVLTDLNGNITDLKKNYINWFDFNKNFKLSNIKSNKNFLPGHKLRYEIDNILNKKREIEIFYPSSRIETKKDLFVDSMFHICVENSKFENYITEKLIDCFMSYTVPIYWGAPNVNETFNSKGIITFETIEELDEILDNLTIGDYNKRIPFMEENYKISYDNYAFFFDRINEIIIKL
jgi:hypothetical protein